jgi:hypothetical protein
MNPNLPVIDSLVPFSNNNNMSLYQKAFQLSGSELREVKSTTLGKGEKISEQEFNGAPVINGDFYFKSLAKADSADLRILRQKKPFYVISLPLYFDDNQKALIDVDLIGRVGVTYLFVKKDGKWIIAQSYMRWVV